MNVPPERVGAGGNKPLQCAPLPSLPPLQVHPVQLRCRFVSKCSPFRSVTRGLYAVPGMVSARTVRARPRPEALECSWSGSSYISAQRTLHNQSR
jgi:hypothetical protein